jgi:hypothetical protein
MPPVTDLSAALTKKRISVDQCFLSTMVKGDPKSLNLLAALDAAHGQGKVICPIHLEESIFESAFFPPSTRLKVFALQNRISDGYSFHSLAQQLRYQTFAFVMPGLVFPNLRSVSLQIKADTDFDALAKTYQSAKDDYVDRLSKMPYPPKSYKPGMKGDELADFIAAERSGSMYRILLALRSTGTTTTGKEEWDFTAQIGEFLHRLQLTAKDLDLLIEKVIAKDWQSIPYLWAHSRINAQVELGYLGTRKATVNDQLDISRITIALNDANVLLCDTAMSEMIRQSKVQDIFSDVKVFSMKQREEAAEYIATL